jgi:hypothetical protein
VILVMRRLLLRPGGCMNMWPTAVVALPQL